MRRTNLVRGRYLFSKVLFLGFLIICSCSEKQKADEEKTEEVSNQRSCNIQVYKHDTITPGRMGFGFILVTNDSLKIDQPNIPGIQGMHTFSSEVDAAVIADAMCEKIRMGIFPPTVTVDEIEKLKIDIK